MKLHYKIYTLLSCVLLLGLLSVNAGAQSSEKTVISNTDKTITIYPIPANNKVYVRLSSALSGEVEKVQIVNLIGRKLTEQTIIDRSVSDIAFTDIGEYPQGVYMIVARDKFGKIVQSAKMVINR